MLMIIFAFLLLFAESALLSRLNGNAFAETPYLVSAVLLTALLIVAATNSKERWRVPKFLAKIGSVSLGIYLVHIPVIGTLGSLRVAFASPMWELVFPVVVFLVSYFIVLGLVRIPYVRSIVS